MRSNWYPRWLRARVAIAVVALALVMPAPVVADPAPPDDASAAVSRLADLSHEAERLTEQWHNARADLEARRADRAAATRAVETAAVEAERSRADQAEFRERVDRFLAASLRGAAAFEFAAVFASESPRDLLDRMEALDFVAADNDAALRALRSAVEGTRVAEDAAQEAEGRAAAAERDAERLTVELEQRQRDMDRQIAVVRGQLAQLAPPDRDSYLGGGQIDFVPIGPLGEGVAVDAMRRALTQQGKPYVWAAEGPDSFDCSGLLYWAYRQVGVSLPRPSRDQATVGNAVPREQIRPGDLIAFYRPVSHIGIYVGNGKLVHAPQGGDVVKVASVQWSDVTAIRRIAS